MGLRHDEKIVTTAVKLSQTLSSRKVRYCLRTEYGIYVSHATISKWTKKFDVYALCKKRGLEYNKVRDLTANLLRRNELTADEHDLPYLQFIENNFYGLCKRMRISNVPHGVELRHDSDREIYSLKIK